MQAIIRDRLPESMQVCRNDGYPDRLQTGTGEVLPYPRRLAIL
ncbi:hypothetical protein [Elizabethkingia miricola]|nr:hypothetical protein [Elizabethkingia miricola]